MPNPDSKVPAYQFNNGKLYMMSRSGLVTYDGHSATISDAYSPKTVLILAVVLGYIPLLVCLNVIASIIESHGGLFDMAFITVFTVIFVGGAFSAIRRGRGLLQGHLAANMPNADLNDPAYKAHLHTIYQRESRKAANAPVGSGFIHKLLGWFMLLVFGGVGIAGLVLSGMHVMNAIEKSKVRTERQAEKKLDPATREAHLLAKLTKLPDSPDSLGKRASINDDLGALNIGQGNNRAGAKYYQAALDLRLQELDAVLTSKDFETVLKSLAKNAVYLVEAQLAADPQTDLVPLEKHLLDAVTANSTRLNLSKYNEQRSLVRQIAKTLKHRKYRDMAAHTSEQIQMLNSLSDGERRAGLEKLLQELFATVTEPSTN